MRYKISLSFAFLFLLLGSSLFVLFLEQPSTLAAQALAAPSFTNWFGRDALGRDLFFRVIEGSRVSLGIGILATMGSFALAVVVAFMAFRSPHWLNDMIMRAVEVMMALPSLVVISLLVLLFANAFNQETQLAKVFFVACSLILTSWFSLARQLRTLLEGERNKPYVEAARAIGSSESRIYFRHVLPNLATPLLVLLGLQIPNQLLFESFLSFVGLGIQPPTASWGVLIQDGWRSLASYPHLILMPSLVLFLTVLAINVLFEELRKSLHPGLRKLI